MKLSIWLLILLKMCIIFRSHWNWNCFFESQMAHIYCFIQTNVLIYYRFMRKNLQTTKLFHLQCGAIANTIELDTLLSTYHINNEEATNLFSKTKFAVNVTVISLWNYLKCKTFVDETRTNNQRNIGFWVQSFKSIIKFWVKWHALRDSNV